VKRREGFDGEHLPSGIGESGSQKSVIKNVVMQAAVFGIGVRARAKLGDGAGRWITVEVMKRENFIQMGEIVLGSLSFEIGYKVGQRRDGPAVVEGAGGVGQSDEQVATGAGYSQPFTQCSEGIGHMF